MRPQTTNAALHAIDLRHSSNRHHSSIFLGSPEILLRIIILSLRLRSPFHSLPSIHILIRLLLILHLQSLLLRQSFLLLPLRTLSLSTSSEAKSREKGLHWDLHWGWRWYTFSCRAAFSFRRSSFSNSAFSAARSGNFSTLVLLSRLIISLILFSTRTFLTCFWRWNPI